MVMEYNTNVPEEIPFDFGYRQIKMRIETDATLVLTQEQMMKFVKPTVDQILDCVDGILHKSPEIQYIVLVGGYGSSPVLGDVFRTKYSNAPPIFELTFAQISSTEVEYKCQGSKANEVTRPVLVHGPWMVQPTSMEASQRVDGRCHPETRKTDQSE
jgi:hypothetical protein